MQCTTTHPHRTSTTTFITFHPTINTTMFTPITTTIICIDTATINNIGTIINSPAHPVTIISFTSATVATAPTTAVKATDFTIAPTTNTIYFKVCTAHSFLLMG